MVYVQKGGLIQLVPEERVGRYLQDGFCTLNATESYLQKEDKNKPVGEKGALPPKGK